MRGNTIFAIRAMLAAILVAMLLAGCVSMGTLNSTSPQQMQAQLDQADALYGQRQYDQAQATLAQIDRGQLAAENAARYDTLSAEIALSHGDSARAIALTANPSSTLSPDLLVRLLNVRFRAQEAAGDAYSAAHTRAQLDPLLAGAQRADNEQHINDLLTAVGRDPLKAHYDALPDNDPLKPYVQAALMKMGVTLPRVLPQLDHPVGTQIGEGSAVQREGYAMPAQVALLLPAHGSLATPADAVRQGFFTAYFADTSDSPRPRVRTYDSGGTPAQTQAAYTQAVADGAQLVIGPLGRNDVAAMFSQPSLTVPLLALNHPDNNAPPPSGSAEFGLLPEAEGAQAAAHMVERGIHRAIVFTGSGDVVRRTAAAFKAQFESLGGQVLNQTMLPSSGVDFSDRIKTALSGADVSSGILILMRPQQARLLMPQLHLAGAQQPVFATSLVYAGMDSATADSDLDGVEFCDAPWLFDAQPGLPSHTAIAAKLSDARGPAARLFAFGMDAYALTPYLGWLRTHPGAYVPGATGQLTEDVQGRVHRTPVWASFSGGIARPVAADLDATSAPDASSGQ